MHKFLYLMCNTYSFLTNYIYCSAEPVAQSVASLIADPGIVSLILAQPYAFMEFDHEIFSMLILLLPPIQEGL